MDEYDATLRAVEKLIERAAQEVRNARLKRVVRVINVNRDDWTPPNKDVHTCTDECQDNVCVITVKELETVHRKAHEHIAWLNRFMPLPTKD